MFQTLLVGVITHLKDWGSGISVHHLKLEKTSVRSDVSSALRQANQIQELSLNLGNSFIISNPEA